MAIRNWKDIPLFKDVTDENMTQGFVEAFYSFVNYLNVQTKILINRMVI